MLALRESMSLFVEFIAFIEIAAKALGSSLRHLAFCARFRGVSF